MYVLAYMINGKWFFEEFVSETGSPKEQQQVSGKALAAYRERMQFEPKEPVKLLRQILPAKR